MHNELDMTPRRPCYINVKNLVGVILAHNSLEVYMKGVSVQHFPLRRLSFVCLLGKCTLGSDVWIELAEKGISVHMYDAYGKKQLTLVPGNPPLNLLYQKLAHAVDINFVRFEAERMSVDYLSKNTDLVTQIGHIYADIQDNPAYAKGLKKAKPLSIRWFDFFVRHLWCAFCCENAIPQESPQARQVFNWLEYIVSPFQAEFARRLAFLDAFEKCPEPLLDAFCYIEAFIDVEIRLFLSDLIELIEDPSLWRQVTNT